MVGAQLGSSGSVVKFRENREGDRMSERSSLGQTADLVGLDRDDARELARLIGLLLRDHPATEIHAILQGLSSGQGAPANDRDRLVFRARTIFSERRRRAEFFPRSLFNEHGWDTLLAIYITDFAGGRQTIGKLVSWIGAPATTSLRWIDYLENHHFVSRQRHKDNLRVVFVDLTDKGREAVDTYLQKLPDPPHAL
jgi:DNA-binding MarR family transcriptional regulator